MFRVKANIAFELEKPGAKIVFSVHGGDGKITVLAITWLALSSDITFHQVTTIYETPHFRTRAKPPSRYDVHG